jgi:acyl-coenzyme A synthetase/AMP-(fatty) acid ligase
VVLSPAGRSIGEEEVKRRLDVWVKETLSKFKQLRGGIEVVDAIPKSPTGKVLRRVLQERYEAGHKVVAKL